MEEMLRAAPRPTGTGDLFQLLRDGQPRTRADLAEITGQARSTIATRVDSLKARGLIAPVGEANSTGGRPPAMFAFNPGAKVVLGADLGARSARIALTDLGSNILAEAQAPLPIADGPDVVLKWVHAEGARLLTQAGRDPDELVSIGIGVPGPVQHQDGRPINPPIMPGWDDVEIPALMRKHFDVPVLVDNDVNIMALGEHRTSWSHINDLLFLKVATGIGAGIIADGELRRGAQGAAGDIGHIAVPAGAEVPCRCGNMGCVEAIASGQAVADALRQNGSEATTSSDVVGLVRAGDMAASHAVREAGRNIGMVLAGCVSLLNPSVIVVGGALSEAGEHLIAGIREVVYKRSLPLATQHLRITTSLSRGRAGVLGASAMAADHVLSPTAIDQITS